jgi:hypothetical protein
MTYLLLALSYRVIVNSSQYNNSVVLKIRNIMNVKFLQST